MDDLDFYPRSPCGERHTWARGSRVTYVISIHALLAESDVVHTLKLANPVLFLSTLSLRRATASNRTERQERHISIHALLAESDSIGSIINNVIDNFYPRSPCGERRYRTCVPLVGRPFLSTLSLRRATFSGSAWVQEFPISIHALLAESDANDHAPSSKLSAFLSTLSLRRATSMNAAVMCLRYSFLSPLSLRRATPEDPPVVLAVLFLSTLSLRRATH